MSQNSKIEWTDATWNPIRGCSRVSEGCRNCYAEKIAARFSKPDQPFHGLAEMKRGEARWTGVMQLVAGKLDEPLHWKKPRRVFVNSMSDLFHEKVNFEWIKKVWNVISECPQHTFQILTKRPQRMLDFAQWMAGADDISIAAWPRNTWLGVSVEDQSTADERIPLLLKTPASVRFISAEPLLSEIKLRWEWVSAGKPLGGGPQVNLREPWAEPTPLPKLDWVICGGESGPGARPMHPDWARTIRDQCNAAAVPFFFKQWGEWREELPNIPTVTFDADKFVMAEKSSRCYVSVNGHVIKREKAMKSNTPYRSMDRVGKKEAGRTLDGREWNEYPI